MSTTLKCDSGTVFLQNLKYTGLETRLVSTSIGQDSPRSLIQTHLQNLLKLGLYIVILCFEFNMSEPQTGIHKFAFYFQSAFVIHIRTKRKRS